MGGVMLAAATRGGGGVAPTGEGRCDCCHEGGGGGIAGAREGCGRDRVQVRLKTAGNLPVVVAMVPTFLASTVTHFLPATTP